MEQVKSDDTEKKTEKVETEVEPKQTTPETNQQTVENQPEENQGIITETAESGNGVPFTDLVTRAEVAELIKQKMEPFIAKFEALTSENEGLKEQLAHISEKYEEKDFGSPDKGSTTKTETEQFSSYDDYIKMYSK